MIGVEVEGIAIVRGSVAKDSFLKASPPEAHLPRFIGSPYSVSHQRGPSFRW